MSPGRHDLLSETPSLWLPRELEEVISKDWKMWRQEKDPGEEIMSYLWQPQEAGAGTGNERYEEVVVQV